MEKTSQFIDLGKKQSELFVANNVGYMECLIKFESCRSIMNICYRILVIKKAIPSIEYLPLSEKNNLWETAKELSNNRLDKNKLIELVKALITLEYFLQCTI